MDAESLQQSGRRRRGCLDAFLVFSVLILFVAVSAVTAGGLILLMELRSKLEGSRPDSEYMTQAKSTGDTAAPAYKMQNFAYLEANSSLLKNHTMPWAPVYHGTGTSVGSLFSFDRVQHSLQPMKEGTYFMYLDLNFTCTSICSEGIVTVRLGDKLTCKVSLPANAETSVSHKCWTVSRINENTRLLTEMRVPEQGLKHWKLEIKDSGLGMFLVD